MFCNCPHCRALVATDPVSGLPPERCPRCGGALRDATTPASEPEAASPVPHAAMEAPAADTAAPVAPVAPADSVPAPAPAPGPATAVESAAPTASDAAAASTAPPQPFAGVIASLLRHRHAPADTAVSGDAPETASTAQTQAEAAPAAEGGAMSAHAPTADASAPAGATDAAAAAPAAAAPDDSDVTAVIVTDDKGGNTAIVAGPDRPTGGSDAADRLVPSPSPVSIEAADSAAVDDAAHTHAAQPSAIAAAAPAETDQARGPAADIEVQAAAATPALPATTPAADPDALAARRPATATATGIEVEIAAEDETAAAAVDPPDPPAPLPRRPAAPSFAAGAAQTPPVPRRQRWLAATAIAVLALILAVQVLLADRDNLAADARWRPLLQRMCSIAGCTLPPWREPDALRLLALDVRAHPSRPNALRASATLRNDAAWPQAWPQLVLTLSDVDGRVLGARAFDAGEYLGQAPTQDGLASGQSAMIRVDVLEPAGGAVSYAFDLR